MFIIDCVIRKRSIIFLPYDSLGFCQKSSCCSYFYVSYLHELQVQRKIDLVYGGGSVGLMGLISQTVYDGGCHVLG